MEGRAIIPIIFLFIFNNAFWPLFQSKTDFLNVYSLFARLWFYLQ